MVVCVCMHGCWWLLVAAALNQWQHSSCGYGCPVWAGSWERRRRRNWAGRWDHFYQNSRIPFMRQLVSIAKMSWFTVERWWIYNCILFILLQRHCRWHYPASKCAAAYRHYTPATSRESCPGYFHLTQEFGNGCSDSRESQATGNELKKGVTLVISAGCPAFLYFPIFSHLRNVETCRDIRCMQQCTYLVQPYRCYWTSSFTY